MKIPKRAHIEHRYSYHKPEGKQAETYEWVRAQVRDLAHKLEAAVPCSDEKGRMFDALDDVMFRANAAIARERGGLSGPPKAVE